MAKNSPRRQPWLQRRWVPLLALVATIAVVIGFGYLFMQQDKVPDKIATLAAGAALISLFFGGVQLWLADRQETILERQDAELHERARLVLWANHLRDDFKAALKNLYIDDPQHPEGKRRPTASEAKFLPEIYLTIANVGTRTARECTVVLLVPWNETNFINTKSRGWKMIDNEEVGGARYNRLELPLWKSLFFPNHETVLGSYILLRHTDYPGKLLYRLLYADDATPSPTGWNELKTRKDMPPEDLPSA